MSDQPQEHRITDLSALSPENIKYRNTEFLLSDRHHYDISTQSKRELRRRIWNVRNGDLRRLFDDFPRDEPLTDQCALWVHAVVGKHFFPDANHRTAIATLRKLLGENGVPLEKWPTDELEAVRDASHRVRREIEPVRLDTIYRRDELFDVWYRFFDHVLKTR